MNQRFLKMFLNHKDAALHASVSRFGLTLLLSP